MSDPHFFDEQSARRIGDYVKRRESQQADLTGPRFPRLPAPELTAFRVVSDLSQEAIDAGTAVHGRTVTCDFASDAQPGLARLGNGCLGPSGAACNGIVSCFPCDVTVTLVDTEEVAGPLGTTWAFSWAGSFSTSEIDADKCSWRWVTDYVPTSANAAGVRLQLGNGLDFLGVGGCQKFVIRDVNRFGDTDPGGGGYDAGSSYTINAEPNCTKVVFRTGGQSSVWGPPYRPIYELTWTCTDEQIDAGQVLLESMLPECVLGRVTGGETPAGRWTVDLSLFGGSPDPGAVILAKNIGGRWYAIGGRNTRIVGDKAGGSDPFRLDVDGCDFRQVPFVYMNQTYGADVVAGRTHVITWNHQKRTYYAARFEDCDGEPNEAMNPYRCPCAWDCGDCMPLVYNVDGCEWVYTTTSCRSTDLATWAEPTFEAKKRPEWDHGYYATPIGEGNPDCGCVWQLVQYCIDDPDGNRGRSWVVEGWCHNSSENTTDHFGPTIVQDWEAKCEGARFPFSMSFGGCCCECNPGCDNACCDNTPDPIFVDDGTVEVECALTDECTFWIGTTDSDFAGYCGPVTVQVYCEGVAEEMGLQIGPDYYGGVAITCSPFGGTTIITSVSGQPECGGGNDYTITISG